MWRIPSWRRLRQFRLTHYWRLFLFALTAAAVAGLVVMLISPAHSGLFLFGIYAIPSNSILPVPHEPGLLFFAKYYEPLLIAVAGTLGTAIAAFADYGVVERALKHPKINGAREAKLYKWSVRWLMRFPFLTISLFAFTPLPIYVVRVLAPASGYPVGRYVIAIMVGRLPRFFIVAWIGHMFKFPTWSLIALFFGLIAIMYIGSKATGTAGLDDEPVEDGEEIIVPDLTDPDHPLPDISSSQLPRV